MKLRQIGWRAPRAAPFASLSWAITHPFGTGGIYPNFPEGGLDSWAVEYHGPNRERLLDVRRRYDPEGVLG